MGVHFDRGRALFALKRYADAIAEYQQELAEEPNCCASQANIAAALINLGRTGEARRNIEQTLAMAPNYAYAHYLRSFIESNTGLDSGALQAIAEAIRLDQSALNFTRRATLLRLQHRHVECLATCEEALARDARFQPALLLQARALQSLDRPDEAAEVLRLALALNPEDPDAHEALGSVALSAGDPAEALDALREARRIDPIQHHDRGKILDAYARRMWPFRQIDLARKRYWRLAPLVRWAIDAAVLTPLLGLHPLLRPTISDSSPIATIVYFFAGNLFVGLALSRVYPAALARLIARRELDLRWHVAIFSSLRTIVGILAAHWLGSVVAILGSVAAGVAFFACSMAMVLRRLRDWRLKLNEFHGLMTFAMLGFAIGCLGPALVFDDLLLLGETRKASLYWLGVLLVTGLSALGRQLVDRRERTATIRPSEQSTAAGSHTSHS